MALAVVFGILLSSFSAVGSEIILDSGACSRMLADQGSGSTSRIIIASDSQNINVYSEKDIDSTAEAWNRQEPDPREGLFRRMKLAGPTRFAMSPPADAAFVELLALAPNFHEVIADLRKRAALARHGVEAMTFARPILLLGDPGVGKTHFAQSLAKVIGVHFEFQSMNSLTAGWVLSGASAGWKNAKEGVVARALINGPSANPLILLDEIDKASGGREYDPVAPLLTLLEPETSVKFRDEFLEVPLNARHILWIATANSLESLPAPILSRFRVYEIPRLSKEQTKQVATYLYRKILNEHPGWPFHEQPGDDLLEALSNLSPRDLDLVLQDALANAFSRAQSGLKRDEKIRVDPKVDLNLAIVNRERARIGF